MLKCEEKLKGLLDFLCDFLNAFKWQFWQNFEKIASKDQGVKNPNFSIFNGHLFKQIFELDDNFKLRCRQ